MLQHVLRVGCEQQLQVLDVVVKWGRGRGCLRLGPGPLVPCHNCPKPATTASMTLRDVIGTFIQHSMAWHGMVEILLRFFRKHKKVACSGMSLKCVCVRCGNSLDLRSLLLRPPPPGIHSRQLLCRTRSLNVINAHSHVKHVCMSYAHLASGGQVLQFDLVRFSVRPLLTL